MISPYQVPALLKEEFPLIKGSLHPTLSLHGYIYQSFHLFADYTRAAIEDHRFQSVKKCLCLASRMYREGDVEVKNYISTEFVESFITNLPKNALEKQLLKSLIPSNLLPLCGNHLLESK